MKVPGTALCFLDISLFHTSCLSGNIPNRSDVLTGIFFVGWIKKASLGRLKTGGSNFTSSPTRTRVGRGDAALVHAVDVIVQSG